MGADDDNVLQFPGAWAPRLVEPRRPQLFPRRTSRVGYVIRVDLDGTEPSVWRRLRLASDLTLPQVHDVLQVAMGWTDSHLHHFVKGPSRDWSVAPFLNPFDVKEGDEGIPETGIRLDEVLTSPGDQIAYEYDFGDSWWHTLALEDVVDWVEGEPDAACVARERACPPEDVGGIPGYQEMLDVLDGRADPDNAEWTEQLLRWLPDGYDPTSFSVTGTNEQLATAPLPALDDWHPAIGDLLSRAGGSAMSEAGELIKRALRGPHELDAAQTASAAHRYQYLLRTIGPGLKLTAAGYLPPRVVQTISHDLAMDDFWIGRGKREDATPPVLTLRESAMAVGLLRKSRGELLPTAAGRRLAENPSGLLRHVGSRLPVGRPYERDAGLIALLQEAAATPVEDRPRQRAEIMNSLHWQVDGESLERATSWWARPTVDVLDELVPYRRYLERDTPEHIVKRSLVARALLRRG